MFSGSSDSSPLSVCLMSRSEVLSCISLASATASSSFAKVPVLALNASLLRNCSGVLCFPRPTAVLFDSSKLSCVSISVTAIGIFIERICSAISGKTSVSLAR